MHEQQTKLMEKMNRCSAAVLICVAMVISFAVSFISVDGVATDEGSYLVVPFRLWMGDALLVDDWFPEQLNGVLLLPFFALYEAVMHSTTGIYLYFRLLYFLIKLLAAGFAWKRFNKQHDLHISEVLAISVFLLYTPFNINSLSYNVFVYIGLFCLCVIALTHQQDLRQIKKDFVISGIIYGVMVLAQPYCILMYLFACLCVAVWLLIKGRKSEHHELRNYILGSLLSFTIGGLVIALPFLFFVFSRASMAELVNHIPYIFNEPDHYSSLNPLSAHYLKLYVLWWQIEQEMLPLFYIMVAGLIIVIAMAGLRKIDQRHLGLYQTIAIIVSTVTTIVTTLWMLRYMSNYGGNRFFLWFLIYAAELCLIMKNKGQRLRYATVLLLVMMSVGCMAFGTNTALLSAAIPMSVLACCSFGMLHIIVTESMKSGRIAAEASILVMAIVLVGGTFIIRTEPLRRLTSVKEQAVYLQEGPLAGTFSPNGDYGYGNITKLFEEISLRKNDILFSPTCSEIAYLSAQVEISTYGDFYTSAIDYDRMYTYWELHPAKIPTVIYYSFLTEEDLVHWKNDMGLSVYKPIYLEDGSMIALHELR